MKVYITSNIASLFPVLFQLWSTGTPTGSYGLTSIAPSPKKPVKRIAIIGSGISGLSVTHALINNVHRNPKGNNNANVNDSRNNNNSFDVIDIFDARTDFDHTAGAGIQLNGGLSILGKINPSLQSAVYNAGIPQVQIQSRTNPWFTSTSTPTPSTNTTNNKLYDILLQLDLQNVVESAGGDIADALLLPQIVSNNNDTEMGRQKGNTNDGKKKLLWISIMRGALQRALYEALPPSPQNDGKNKWRIQFQKKLVNLRSSTSSSSSSTTNSHSNSHSNDDDTVIYCQFNDGTESGPYDLVIGCEGINSIVKQYVESNGQVKVPTKTTTTTAPTDIVLDSLNVRSAIYSGIRIRYAVADGDRNQQDATTTAKLTQYFGNGAYALHGTYGAGVNQPNTQCAFIVYLDENYIGPFQKKDTKKENRPTESSSSATKTSAPTIGENADWTQDQRRTIDTARKNMMEQLNVCQIPSDTNDDVLRQTISKANRFFELGSYYHNPFGSWSCTVPSSSLSTSSSRDQSNNNAHVVLCGDAAHALPPFLGQGSNQAIQDAYCLVERIVEYNTRIENGDTNVNLQSLLNDYQKIRWQPCFEIFWKAAFLGYLETGGIDGFYSKFRDVFFKSMGIIGVASKVLLNAATPKV